MAVVLASLLGTSLLCLFSYLLCYAAVFIKFTYYAQNYAQEKLCLAYITICIQIFMNTVSHHL